MGIHTYIRACPDCAGVIYTYKLVHSGMHIGVAMGYRIQGAGCRVQVQGGLVMLKVHVES